MWNSTEPIFHSRFHHKLKILNFDLRELNKDVYSDLPVRTKVAWENLCVKQTEALQNPTTKTFEVITKASKCWYHLAGIKEQIFKTEITHQMVEIGISKHIFFH